MYTIRISEDASLTQVFVPLALPDGDYIDNITNVTLTPKSGGTITVPGSQLNAVPITFGDKVYPINTGVLLDIDVGQIPTVDGETPSTYNDYLSIVWTSHFGNALNEKLLFIVFDDYPVTNVFPIDREGTAPTPDGSYDAVIGQPEGETHMGTFTGSTIPDNVSVKAGMQALETAHEVVKTKTDQITVTAATDLDAIRTKTSNLTVTQAVDLDTLETDVAASKLKTDLLGMSGPIDLDGIQTKADHLTVTASTNLDTIRTDVASNKTTLTISSLSSANANLPPGRYIVDTSGGAFSVTVSEGPGEWILYDPEATTETNSLTINAGGDTFNGTAGPLIYDGGAASIVLSRVNGANDMTVTISSLLPIGVGDQAKLNNISITQPVNLDTVETDVAASKTKTNLITINSATDLDAIRTKANYTTVTAAVSLDRLRIRVLDVTDYGADPTGVADSTAAIQAAMTAAQPAAPSISIGDGSSINRREPAALLFPKGTYRITSSLTDSTSGLGIIWLGHGAILKADGISADRWMVELGQQGHETNAPMHVYIKGITFHKLDRGLRIGGVDNNINLGRVYFEDCNFIGNINDNGFAVRVYNRSASIEFKNCQWDNTAIALEVQSCDLVYLNECRMQIRHFPKLSEPRRQKFHGFFVVRHGQMHVRNFIANTPNPGAWAPGGTYAVGDVRKVNSTDDSPDKGNRWYYCVAGHTASGGQVFNEAYIATYWELCEDPSNPMGWFKAEEFPDWAPSTHYVIGDIVYNSGTLYWCNTAHDSAALWGTHSAKFTAVNTNSISVWTDITIDDSLFGGEGGGIPPVLWNTPPNTAAAAIQYQKALVIRNCQIGNDLQGYGVETYAVACLFAHRPNNFVFKNNRFAFTYCLPADYWVDATMPVWPPTSSVSASQLTPCDVDISGNNGSAFRSVTELASAYWSYSPNWTPYDMRVPTLYQNDAGPQLPGDHRAFKTNNTSSTSISRFLGAEPGKVFTVYITDANTTILNGNYIKLSGGATFTPGAAGGCITFLVIDDPTYQSRCLELGRITFA